MELNGISGLSAWLVYNKVIFGLVFCRRFNYAANEQSLLLSGLNECKTIDDFKTVREALSNERFDKVNFTFAEAITIFKDMSERDKRESLLECLTFIDLSKEEQLILLSLNKDENGISIGSANIKNYSTTKIIEFLLCSLLQCSLVSCNFGLMNSGDIKALSQYRVDVRNEANEILSKNSEAKTGNVISLALKSIAAKLKSD